MTLSFFWMGGPSWVVDVDGLRVGCDPVLAPAGTKYPKMGRRTVGPRPLRNGTDSIRLWLLTHDHADHIDGQGLDYISPLATIVARDNLADRIGGRFDDVTYLDWGETTELEIGGVPLSVEAVPAIHGSSPKMVQMAGRVNGYLVTTRRDGDPWSLYATGDTVPDPKIHRAIGGRPIDLFVPNMGNALASIPGGPITLSVPLLREMLDGLGPDITVPVHLAEFEWWEMTSEDLEQLAGLPGIVMPRLGEWVELLDR